MAVSKHDLKPSGMIFAKICMRPWFRRCLKSQLFLRKMNLFEICQIQNVEQAHLLSVPTLPAPKTFNSFFNNKTRNSLMSNPWSCYSKQYNIITIYKYLRGDIPKEKLMGCWSKNNFKPQKSPWVLNKLTILHVIA